MVIKSSSSGLRDWIVQRVSSVLIGLYVILLAIYLLENHPLYFAQWHHLFSQAGMKIATIVVLIAILWHAWIGLWTVFTDYIKNSSLRLVLQSMVIILLVSYVIWGLEILWG